MRKTFTAMMLGAVGLMGSAPAVAGSAYDFSFTSIDGEPMPLSEFRGRPILLVNTASRCGFTDQYDGLQALWARYGGETGLVVIGAPSNDFRQELGTEDEVKRFCEVTFGIDFPMTEIVHVKGAKAHPFFAWAAAQSEEPGWNFHKYLIDGEGRLAQSYPTTEDPSSPRLKRRIEKLLKRAE